MDGATVENVAAKGAGNAQVFNVNGSATGIKQVQYSPSTVDLPPSLQSDHIGEYYKLTFNDGSKIKIVDPTSYRPSFNNGQPLYDKRTTYLNPNGQSVIFDSVTNTWIPK